MSKRLLRVNELLKQELGTYISRQFEFQGVLVSVHEVKVASNLKKADVFIGVIGDQNAVKKVIDKLNHNRVAMQAYIAKRVTMKFTPCLEFHSDDSVERGVRILSLLEEIAEQAPAEPSPDELVDGNDEQQG